MGYRLFSFGQYRDIVRTMKTNGAATKTSGLATCTDRVTNYFFLESGNMGARVEGKTKRKSVKANVTSKFNSKRKASRMGKKVKKGQAGPNTEFITRSAALKRLQITLKDFRRLCILKGIYPRVPVKGLKGNDKVYYDIKDISYIMHEPLLQKFRDFKSFMKKIRRAAGRNQFGEAR